VQKQSFKQIFLLVVHFSLILLIANALTACNDKQKNRINTDDSDDESIPQSYILSDYEANKYSVTLKQRSLHFEDIKTPLMIVHLFQDKKNIAQTQIKMLAQLENQFKQNVVIKHIPINHTGNPDNSAFFKQLQKYLLLQESNILPLIILYKNHRYYTHFEGKIPIEILRHSIQNILKSKG